VGPQLHGEKRHEAVHRAYTGGCGSGKVTQL
jgi:hypothetical protein